MNLVEIKNSVNENEMSGNISIEITRKNSENDDNNKYYSMGPNAFINEHIILQNGLDGAPSHILTLIESLSKKKQLPPSPSR